MSGNPDVLEYYQSKNSKKPIRIIDLKECEVEMPDGQLRIKRDFHGKHLFVVKTSSRIFYLVAKTEEEMNGWISSISQICHFGSVDDAGKYTKTFCPYFLRVVLLKLHLARCLILNYTRFTEDLESLAVFEKICHACPKDNGVTCPHTGSDK